MNEIRIPVLPIPNVVFYPHTSLPLFVIEPVYVQLIKDCIENDLPLGIAQGANAGPFSNVYIVPQMICGIGRPIILDQSEDGTLKVLIKGTGRVKLSRIEQNLPYSIYTANMIFDRIEVFSYADAKIEKLRNILIEWLKKNVQNSIERDSFIGGLHSVHHVIDYLCMFLIHDQEIKQLLLENDSLSERILMLDAVLNTKAPFSENILVNNAIKNFEIVEHFSKISQ